MNLVRLEKVSKIYKKQTVISNLDLTVSKGDLIVLVGQNGSGKSTLLKIIAGLIPLSSGFVHKKKIRCSYLPEQIELPLFINALEYIKTIHDINKTMIDKTLIKRLNLNLEKGIHQLSKGNQKRIMVYLCFSSNADLILLDEPFDGLDELSQKVLLDLIVEYQQMGIGIVISTHELEKFYNQQVKVIHFDAIS